MATQDKDYILEQCKALAIVSMKNGFNREPYPWQLSVLTHMNAMTLPNSGIDPAPLLLCQPTGGGKSLVCDTFAVGQGGITWCVSPLLSLSADQVTNINLKANPDTVAFHLDAIKERTVQVSLTKYILSLPSNLTVIILLSPQALTLPSYSRYQQFLWCVWTGKLKLFSFDEVHLFVSFGLYFRDEFLALREAIFPMLTAASIPILLMTATMTMPMLEHLQDMTGLNILPCNVFWPSALGQQCRHITLCAFINGNPMM